MAESVPDVCEMRVDLMMAEHAGEYDAMMAYAPRPTGQHNSAHRAEVRRYYKGYERIMAAECGVATAVPAYPRPRQDERKYA